LGIEHDLAAWRLAHEHGLPFAFRGDGASMWPTLRAGDEALFVPFDGEPQRGEVLLYRAGDRLLAHRLVGTTGAHLRLRGDAMPDEDPPVSRSAVLGRLTAIRRQGREIQASHPGFHLAGELHPCGPRAMRLLLARIAARLTPGRTRR
jgi:hypothetical protein